jgi:hypothetical protein
MRRIIGNLLWVVVSIMLLWFVAPGGAGATPIASPVPGEVCRPTPELGLADADGNGTVSIDEINKIVDLVGGNEELESLRDQLIEVGITGIRYRDCVPATPVASPVSATPAATPGTPVAKDAMPSAMTDRDGEAAQDSSNRVMLFAVGSVSMVLIGALSVRAARRP